jgi:hypothetical protein
MIPFGRQPAGWQTREEVCRRLGISRFQFQRWYRPRLEPVTFGDTAYRYDPAVIVAVHTRLSGRAGRGRPRLASDDLVQRIHAARSGGMPLRAIATTLEADAVPTPTGKTRWHPSTVANILRHTPLP